MYTDRSTNPYGYVAHNGINFRYSVKNPTSRLARLIAYLRDNGPKSKEDILRDVFNREIGQWTLNTPNFTSRGWGAYLFTGSVVVGFITKTRVNGNHVLYSLGPKSHLVTAVSDFSDATGTP